MDETDHAVHGLQLVTDVVVLGVSRQLSQVGGEGYSVSEKVVFEERMG